MARLIEANKLRKDFLGLPNCYNGFSDTYDKAIIIGVIDEQPTVKAIPIKWIEEYPEKVSEFDEKTLIKIYSVIYEMLEYWEEENETN